MPKFRKVLKLVAILLLALHLGACAAKPPRPDYPGMVFQPANVAQNAAWLVVVHGCLQDAAEMAALTGWNNLAEKNGVVVFYPQQIREANPIRCWNWFDPENQNSDSGEIHAIIGQLKYWQKTLALKPSAIYLVGLSSGAATAAAMTSCYPSEFQATALVSGPAYATANDGIEAISVQQGKVARTKAPPCDPKNFQGKVMIIHGGSDPVVNIKNMQVTLQDFMPANVEERILVDTPDQKMVDYVVEGKTKVRTWMQPKLKHDWSGGKKSMPFSYPTAPSATQAIWDFFTGSTSTQNSGAPTR